MKAKKQAAVKKPDGLRMSEATFKRAMRGVLQAPLDEAAKRKRKARSK